MSGTKGNAADIYAKQLFPTCHGYPLWHPEIEPARGLEIQIGDVGFLKDGAFKRIFNATLPSGHSDQIFGTPEQHEALEIKPFLIHRRENIITTPVRSHSVDLLPSREDITT